MALSKRGLSCIYPSIVNHAEGRIDKLPLLFKQIIGGISSSKASLAAHRGFTPKASHHVSSSLNYQQLCRINHVHKYHCASINQTALSTVSTLTPIFNRSQCNSMNKLGFKKSSEISLPCQQHQTRAKIHTNQTKFDKNTITNQNKIEGGEREHHNPKNKPAADNTKLLPFKEGMSLRLVNENGFLSWCRNSYISAVAGLAMINGSEATLGDAAGTGILIISAFNMVWGSGNHINNLIQLRKAIGMSRTMFFVQVSGAVLHAIFFIIFILMYVKFCDDVRVEEMEHHHHHHDNNQHDHGDIHHQAHAHHNQDFFLFRKKGFHDRCHVEEENHQTGTKSDSNTSLKG